MNMCIEQGLHVFESFRLNVLRRMLAIAMGICLTGGTIGASDIEQLVKLGAKLKTNDGVIVEVNSSVETWMIGDYQLLGKQVELVSLTLSGKTITDENLAALTNLKKLEAISTNASHLSDDAYEHFEAFPKLKRLAFWHPSRNVEGFTGIGLLHLKSLTELKTLTFAGAKTGDKAMEALAELTQLESYSQWHNNETADGLKHLAKLTNLKSLRLGQRLYDYKLKPPASFDNATFDTLAKLNNLETLDIMEARLNFEAVSKLKALPNLKRLHVHKIDITGTDVEKLKSELSEVQIEWEQLTEEEEQTTLNKKLKI